MSKVSGIHEYDKWIEVNVLADDETAESVTLRMQKVFPELRRIRGVCNSSIYGLLEHWWLEWCGVIIEPQRAHPLHPDFLYGEIAEVKP